jgi:Tol biopolymer transport system component
LNLRIAAIALASTFMVGTAGSVARAQGTWRVNVDSTGAETSGYTYPAPSISADGRFTVFSSDSGQLVAGDGNGTFDVFVHDLQTGTTECVSLDLAGNPAGFSYSGAISDDGRYVAFLSDSNALVANDTSLVTDVFVRDRQTGTTELVSVDSNGVQFTDPSGQCSISADGRFVAIVIYDPMLPFFSEIWVRDRQLGTTELVSVDSAGVSIYSSVSPSLSSDGRFVAFGTQSSNGQVWVRDRFFGVTECASLDLDGLPSQAFSYQPSISADGRFVAFVSGDNNMVPGDVNFAYDVFVRDRRLGTTELASVDSSGAQADSHTDFAAISSDGRRVAFLSRATNLVAGDTNGVEDVFIHDRWTGTTEMVSVDTSGNPENAFSQFMAIAPGARFVAFTSRADNLVAGDTNGVEDVFVRDSGLLVPGAASVTPDRSPHRATVDVTILGSGFLSGSQTGVFFGGQPATNVVVVDDATITCTAPTGAPGPADVTIQDTFGSTTVAGLFNYSPAILWSGSPVVGGELMIEYLVEPHDGVFAIAGVPPAVSIPTPPFEGNLGISPFFQLFFVPPAIWPYDVLPLRATIPADPALSGQTVLLQALIGPSLTVAPKDAAWTNVATVTIR